MWGWGRRVSFTFALAPDSRSGTGIFGSLKRSERSEAASSVTMVTLSLNGCNLGL